MMSEPFQIPGLFGKEAINVPKAVDAAIWASDYVFFLGMNIFYTPVLDRILAEKKPAYFAYNSEASTEWLITHYPPPYEPLVKRTDTGVELANNTSEIRFTTPAGTDLTMGVKKGGVRREVGFLEPEKGHTWDILAGALIAVFVEPESCNGTYVIVAGDFPSQIVDREVGSPYTGDKISFTIKEGVITKIEGGIGAKLMNQWLKSWNDERSYVLAHLGIGTDPRQRNDFERYPFYAVAGWDGEWIGGLLTLGVGVEPSHLDLVQRHGSAWFDEEKVVEDEKFVGPLSDEALRIKTGK
jgi:2,5-dihydroxypyridine 5,6-dioxygenase